MCFRKLSCLDGDEGGKNKCANPSAKISPKKKEKRSSRTQDTSGVKHAGHEGERRETPLTLEELEQAFEHFKTGDYVKSKYSDVIQYVQALQAQNNQLARSREGAETALCSFGNRAKLMISHLHPSVRDERTQTGQFTTSSALEFVLGHYQSLWETNCSNCKEIVAIEGEKKRLRQELHKTVSLHQEHVDQITAEYENRLHRHERERSEEKKSLTTLHQDQLNQLGDEHKNEVEKLKSEQDRLTAAHKKELEDLRGKLEGDITALQDELVTFVDRFQPKSDNELQSRFDDLKSWVGRVARSALDVNGEELGKRLNRTTFILLSPKRHHKFALESSIWAILMDGIFATPFKIFGDYSGHFSASWSQLVRENQNPTNSDFDSLEADTFTEKWRCLTFEAMRHAVTKNTTERPANEMIRKSYERNTAKILQSLSEVVLRVSSQDRQADLRKILDQARYLALDCGEQRCRLEFFAPSVKQKISMQNTKTYKDMNGDNNPSLAEGIVQLVVSPGLRRTGDGRGGSLDEVSDLCPAAVYLTETG